MVTLKFTNNTTTGIRTPFFNGLRIGPKQRLEVLLPVQVSAYAIIDLRKLEGSFVEVKAFIQVLKTLDAQLRKYIGSSYLAVVTFDVVSEEKPIILNLEGFVSHLDVGEECVVTPTSVNLDKPWKLVSKNSSIAAIVNNTTIKAMNPGVVTIVFGTKKHNKSYIMTVRQPSTEV